MNSLATMLDYADAGLDFAATATLPLAGYGSVMSGANLIDGILASRAAATVAEGAPTLFNLSRQLAQEEAASAFGVDGGLTAAAIRESRMIIPPGELGNPSLPGGVGKFATPSFRSPSGSFQVHFYMNPTTGSVFYGVDYKTVFAKGFPYGL
jgi:hypothetical protein